MCNFCHCPTETDPTIYFMAIIDVLTLYNAKKKAAHAAKTVKHGVSGLCEWMHIRTFTLY